VLDLTQMLAGPYCTMVLADHGADVIKVEPPQGDMSRGLGPFVEADAARTEGGYFHSINRNKRSIVLDLKNADDRRDFLALVRSADVVIENFRHGVMERLGLSYETLRAENERLVYAAIRGFGDARSGASPYAEWPAYDIVAQSMGGLAHITGDADGAGFPSGSSVGDIYPGTLMALGVVAAINHAKATGEGQFLDVGMYDAILALAETVVVNYGYNETELGPRGQHHPNLMPFGIYPTKDGGVAIAAPGPGHWSQLCQAMERAKPWDGMGYSRPSSV